MHASNQSACLASSLLLYGAWVVEANAAAITSSTVRRSTTATRTPVHTWTAQLIAGWGCGLVTFAPVTCHTMAFTNALQRNCWRAKLPLACTRGHPARGCFLRPGVLFLQQRLPKGIKHALGKRERVCDSSFSFQRESFFSLLYYGEGFHFSLQRESHLQRSVMAL